MKHIVFVSSPESQQIHVWKMNDQGELTLLQVVNTRGQGGAMAVHPANTHLYIGIRPTFGIVSYNIDTQGFLTEIGMVELPGAPTQLTINLDGTTLYSVSYSSSCLNVSSIDKQGIVGTPHQTLVGLTHCHSANIDTTNQVLWVPCLKEDRIRRYRIGKCGGLTPLSPTVLNSSTRSGPRHMAFHHLGGYAYVINELSSTVSIIAVNTTNDDNPCIIQTLDIIPFSFSKTRWGADIHITPNGRWLYCCDRSASIISWFSVTEDGRKLRLSGYQVTETQPRGFNIDSEGRFLVAAGQKSHHISVYTIKEQSGELMPLARYAVGQRPIWVSIFAVK